MFPSLLRRRIAAAAISAGAALLVPAVAAAAEAILYDGNNCSGSYRMLDRSASNLNQMNFDNKVNSIRVITGVWRFYRDANYGEGNGPSFQIGPSGFADYCWSLQEASQGSFPNNRMSSAQLIQDTPAPQPEGVAILYSNTNFGGSYRILTRSVSNLDQVDFDNRTESLRVVYGSWTFFRNSNYGAPSNRPSITLGPGDYPNIANVPGYPQNHFPKDRMSSAQVTAAGGGGQQQAACPGPYRVVAPDNRCVWSCSAGTQPDAASNQCVCQPGLAQTGVDQFGRRQCG